MAKFYVYDNATRRLKSGKFIFSFDVIEQFGGSWRGVLRLEDPEAIAALGTFASTLGIREITEAEFEAFLKKKMTSPSPSPSILPQLQPLPLKGAGAVVLKEPSARTILNPNVTASEAAKPQISDVVVIATAPYVDPLEQRAESKKRRRSNSSS